MTTEEQFHGARDEAVIATALPLTSDETGVAERTSRTRAVGAANILLTLMSGDLGLQADIGKAAIGEMLSRIVANAMDQGIVIEMPDMTR